MGDQTEGLRWWILTLLASCISYEGGLEEVTETLGNIGAEPGLT